MCSGVCVSIGAPLPGSAGLAALWRHADENPCKYRTGGLVSKFTGKKRSSRFWSDPMVFWLFPEQISVLNRAKLFKNWQTGMRNLVLGDCRIIWIHRISDPSGYSLKFRDLFSMGISWFTTYSNQLFFFL
jgi:hypothetical protein